MILDCCLRSQQFHAHHTIFFCVGVLGALCHTDSGRKTVILECSLIPMVRDSANDGAVRYTESISTLIGFALIACFSTTELRVDEIHALCDMFSTKKGFNNNHSSSYVAVRVLGSVLLLHEYQIQFASVLALLFAKYFIVMTGL